VHEYTLGRSFRSTDCSSLFATFSNTVESDKTFRNAALTIGVTHRVVHKRLQEVSKNLSMEALRIYVSSLLPPSASTLKLLKFCADALKHDAGLIQSNFIMLL